ncbi:MAG: VOC family protein [Minwuia sp.]|nr:VOC family protein [Minwuia sp.]
MPGHSVGIPCPRLVLDHLAITARTLEEGVAWVRDSLGIEMPPGGSHPRMGTHNRLLSLGASDFLEVIAVDPDAQPPAVGRWYGLDSFDDSPRIGTWILGTPDIANSLAHAHPDSGPAIEAVRGDLEWLISVPADGSMPMQGAWPTLIQWPSGPLPVTRMQHRGCALHSLTVRHPEAGSIATLLQPQFSDPRIAFETGPLALEATFDTPSGRRTLR